MFRKRTLVGGLVLIGISGYLASLFFDFGGGAGLMPGANVSGNQTISIVDDSDNQREKEPQDSKLATDPHPKVLTICIDDRSYAIRQETGGKPTYRPIVLADLIETVKKTPGNDEGIRVRIVRRKTARVTAWQNLQDELIKVGLPKESVDWQKELVP